MNLFPRQWYPLLYLPYHLLYPLLYPLVRVSFFPPVKGIQVAALHQSVAGQLFLSSTTLQYQGEVSPHHYQSHTVFKRRLEVIEGLSRVTMQEYS